MGINWNCPCLGGMAVGPCGMEFRDAFSCFHNSTADPKGSDCIEKFANMQICMSGYPELYDKDKDDESATSPEQASEAAEKSEGENAADETEKSANPAEPEKSVTASTSETAVKDEKSADNTQPTDSLDSEKPATVAKVEVQSS